MDKGIQFPSAAIIVSKEEHENNILELLIQKAEDSYSRGKVYCIYSDDDVEFENSLSNILEINDKIIPLKYASVMDKNSLADIIKENIKEEKIFWCKGNDLLFPYVKELSILGIKDEEVISDFLFEGDEEVEVIEFPKFIGITLTNRCNYKCFFCNRESNDKYDTIKLQKFYQLKPLIHNAEIINLTGWGEPLSYKYINEVLEFINENNNHQCISLTTNGSVLTEKIAEKLSKNLNQIIISINAASKETYERDMKHGHWEKVINNVRNARKYIPRDKMHFVFVGHLKNIHEFPEFIKMASELDVWAVELLPLQVTSKEILQLSLWFDKEFTNECIRKAKWLGEELNIEVNAREFDSDYEKKINKFACSAPYDQTYISEKGDVAPCCYSGIQTMGNIDIAGSFEMIWNGKKYNRLRKEKYFPECSTCGNANNMNYLTTHINVLLQKQKDLFNDLPLVSVIVPSYNQADWLPKTLESIIAQTYPVWEAVVINDGSTDDTKEIIKKFEKIDSRIKGINKENGGISSALNEGIKNAKGKYFCWLSSDDLFYPDKLELQVKAFDKLDESYGISFGAFDHVDDKDKVTELEHIKPFYDGLEFPQQLKYDMIDGCTVMLPMQIMREMGGFNKQFKHAQDTEFWFRLAAKGYKFHYIEKKLTKRRIHPNQGFTDFGLDCRYDGWWFVDFYLDNYSFRDFYKNLDFTSEKDLEIFMSHFFDMISDPVCHINHPLVFDKFWDWFERGLKTLPVQFRNIIINNGVKFFSLRKEKGIFYREYFQKFKFISNKHYSMKEIPFKYSDEFHDLTLENREDKKEYISRMFRYGQKLLAENNMVYAQGVFKYLADFENYVNEDALKLFTTIAFGNRELNTFIKSFRRKAPITTFPDKVKALYLWAMIQENYSNMDINKVFMSIEDQKIISKTMSWMGRGEKDKIPNSNLLSWNYNVIPYKINHFVKFKCPNCASVNDACMVMQIKETSGSEEVLCLNCLSEFKLSDEQLKKYYDSKTKKSGSFRKHSGKFPKVSFVMRYTNIVGGGVRVAFRYMEWLAKLGCRITIYSDTLKPDWIDLPGKFIQVKDHLDIKNIDADFVVIFSAYDIPKIITKFDSGKVAHLCQGYEGYHLGRNFEELRANKYFYDVLHSFNVKNILVSNHLMDLFKTRFGRIGYYIPNGIDLSTFYVNPFIPREKNSILFLGNPKDPLKGMDFLTSVIAHLQASEKRIDNLKLYVVFGGTSLVNDQDIMKVSGIEIVYKQGLSADKVAELINRVSVVTATSWYEGFSLPVLEAMACGTPVITTANMGAESFCKNGKNSFIVDYGDSDTFAEKLHEILTESIDFEPIIYNGLKTSEEYSVFNSAVKFVDEFQKLLHVDFDKEKVECFLNAFRMGRDSGISWADENFEIYKAISNLENRVQKRYRDIVSIILISFNQVKYTKKCIESIYENTEIGYEIIVVDNASEDSTIEELSKLDNVKIIQNKENLGFPKAVNQGIIAASGKYVLLLNNDTIVTKGWLKRMVDIAESDKNIGMVGPLSNAVSGVQIDKEASYKTIEEMHQYAANKKEENKEKFFEFPRLAFLCTLIKRELIEKIGGLDERFTPGNFEDDDFSLRTQLAGYKTIVAQDVFIHHFGSVSFKAEGDKAYDNRLMINQKKFEEKWGANPDEIWLKGKEIKQRKINYAINKDKFIQHFDRALQFSEEGDYQIALEETLLAKEHFADSSRPGYEEITLADVLNIAGTIAFAMGDLEKANELFQEELLQSDNSARACKSCAEVYIAAEMFEEAKQMLEWAFKVAPEDNEVRKNLIAINEKLGLSSDDNRLEALERDNYQRIQEAEKLIDEDKIDDAEAIIKKVLESDEYHIDGMNDLSVIYLMRGNVVEALKLIEKVLALEPENEVAMANLKYVEENYSN